MLWAFGSTFRSGAETAWFTDEVGSIDIVDSVLPRRGRVEAIGSIVGLVATAVLASIAGFSVALVTAAPPRPRPAVGDEADSCSPRRHIFRAAIGRLFPPVSDRRRRHGAIQQKGAA